MSILNIKMELYRAIYSSNETLTQSLLSNGANPNTFMHDCSMLKWAILKGNTKIIKLLVKYGTDVSEDDMKLGKQKHNPDLLAILTEAQTYISLESSKSDLVVENRNICLYGKMDPVSNTAFDHGDECVLVNEPKNPGPVSFDGEKWHVFKKDSYDTLLYQNNTTHYKRECADGVKHKFCTYYNWYA